MRVLNPPIHERRVPNLLSCDNAPELTGKLLDLRAHHNGG